MPSPKDALKQNDHSTSFQMQMSADRQLLSDSLLQLFINYAWKDNYGKCSKDEARKFRDWVSSEKIDFSDENWPSSIKPINNRDCYHSRDWWIGTIPAIFYEVAYKLKNFLPILFNCNGNINFVDENGRTILHVFLASIENKTRSPKSETYKDTKLVERLIEKGASVNIVDKQGNTPFAMAAMYGQKENVQIMLENFTNTDTCDKDGNTALHIVVDKSLTIEGEYEKGYTEIVKSLLLKGADLTKKNKKGLTPVQLAASKYNVDVLQVFKANGVDFKILTDDTENLIFLACKDKWHVKDETRVLKTIDFLVDEGCDINELDNNGYSILHYASLWDRAVRHLLKHGAKIDCQTKIHQQTPLHWAVKGYHFNLDTIKALVQAGADVNAKAADGATPLLMAVMRSSPEIIRFLIEQGADVNDKDDIFGFTPLHLAVFEKEKFAQLIDKSNDMNVASNHGVTPLHFASLASNVEIMKSLICRGANVDCRDSLNQTSLHMILLGNFFLNLEKIVGIKFIDEQSKKISFVHEMWSSLWCRYDSQRQRDAIEVIIKSEKVDINAKDVNGRRALHLASRELLGNSIEKLLELGAQIDVFDQNGRLPFHEVIESGNIRGLECLLNFGMDVNEKSLNRLVISSKKDVKDVVFGHLVKLKAAGLPIANIYKTHVNKPKYRAELNRYSNEVQRMKNCHMNGSSVSIYEFLHMNWKRRLTVIPCGLNYHWYNGFEVYHKIIQSSFREALERKRLLEPAIEAWYRINKYHLPDICVEYIFNFLSNGHLTALIESADLNCDDKST